MSLIADNTLGHPPVPNDITGVAQAIAQLTEALVTNEETRARLLNELNDAQRLFDNLVSSVRETPHVASIWAAPMAAVGFPGPSR